MCIRHSSQKSKNSVRHSEPYPPFIRAVTTIKMHAFLSFLQRLDCYCTILNGGLSYPRTFAIHSMLYMAYAYYLINRYRGKPLDYDCILQTPIATCQVAWDNTDIT